jgi:hypothetical protein
LGERIKGMDYQKIIDFLARDWEKFVERATNAYEEGVDIALDQWDTFKKLDNRYKGAILGGAGFFVLILIIIIGLSLRGKSVPIIATLETSGVLGGKFIALENESEDAISPVIFILDDRYIYRRDEVGPLQEFKLFLKDFHYMKGNLEEGEVVKEDLVPYTLKVICPFGEKEIELTRKKKGWFR